MDFMFPVSFYQVCLCESHNTPHACLQINRNRIHPIHLIYIFGERLGSQAVPVLRERWTASRYFDRVLWNILLETKLISNSARTCNSHTMSMPSSPPPEMDQLADYPVSPPTPPTPRQNSENNDKCYTFDSQNYVLLPDLVIDERLSSYIFVDGQTLPRWEVIKDGLLNLKKNCSPNARGSLTEAFHKTVELYNPGLECTFAVFDDMIQLASQNWSLVEVKEVVAFMAECSLWTEWLFPNGVRLLTGQEFGVEGIQLSKRQVMCLLANGFFCCYPERIRGRKGGYSDYPVINFDKLFDDKGQKRFWNWRSWTRNSSVQKLLCIFNYFRVMKERAHIGVPCPGSIIIKRKTLSPEDTPRWGPSLTDGPCKVKVYQEGSIEETEGGLRVDFANMYVGGGTLGQGAAMEEIMFACSPEMIVSQLVSKRLRDNECLIISGCEKVSTGQGYSTGFKWAGNYLDENGGEGNHVAVIDAVRFKRCSLMTQLEKKWMDRELTKCFVAFKGEQFKVCSGKWGCGVFNGNPLLKCILQWIACSVAGVRCLELYTFGDDYLQWQMEEIVKAAQEGNVTVGKVYDSLVKFGDNSRAKWWWQQVREQHLFEYLLEELGSNGAGVGGRGGGDMDGVVMSKGEAAALWLSQHHPNFELICKCAGVVGAILMWWGMAYWYGGEM